MQLNGHDTSPTDPGPPSITAQRPEGGVDSTRDGPLAASGHPAFIETQPTVVSGRPPVPSGDENSLLETAQALAGKSLAHFQLLELIGGGGMGAVFQALDTMLERVVAVKVLSPQQARDRDTVRRFRNEAQSAARLDHDNIARVYYVGEQDGWSFIVLEYIAGSNLRDLVAQNGPFESQQAFDITLQLAEALDHASKREVVHRDIKPSNVLLTPEGRAKLVDMGLARLHRVQTPGEDLTASGVTLGTFDYISPEQARDPRTADVRSDMYSLGCTLFFMLTGRPPFPDGTVLQKLLSHSADAPPDPRQWRDDIPPELLAVLNRLLAKRPEDRHQRPSDLIGELILAGERLGWRTATRGEPIYISPKHSRFRWAERHLPWIVPAAAFFIFMVFLDPIWVSDQLSAANDPNFQFGDKEERTSAIGNEPRHVPANSTDRDPANGSSRAPTANEDEPHANDDSAAASARPKQSQYHGEGQSDSSSTGTSSRLIVSNNAQQSTTEDGSRVFDSLRQAIGYARGRSTIRRIELHLNGYLDVSDLSGFDQPVTIAAGAGFRPTLVLRAESTSDSTAPNAMFRIEDGTLTLEHIHLEVRIPIDTVSQHWSVFRMIHPSRVELVNCAITVRNSHGDRQSFLDDVAVFDLAGSTETDGMLDPDVTDASATTHIQLRNCAVRGEATLVRAESAVPVKISWNNGLLVTTERLLMMTGSADEFDGAAGKVELDLDHLTCVVDKGLVWFTTTGNKPFLPRCEVWANDCIFASTPWSSFLSHSGPMAAGGIESLLNYQGARNRYQGILTYWKLGAGTSLRSMTFQDWRGAPQVKEQDSSEAAVAWLSTPKGGVPVSTHRVLDYTLSPENNSAVGTDPEGGDAGMSIPQTAEFPSPVNEIIQRDLFLPF